VPTPVLPAFPATDARSTPRPGRAWKAEPGLEAAGGSVREVLQISLRQGGHGRLAVFDVAISDQEPCHDQDRE
jgi:hypothetical protein